MWQLSILSACLQQKAGWINLAHTPDKTQTHRFLFKDGTRQFPKNSKPNLGSTGKVFGLTNASAHKCLLE